ncbi:tRNA (N6-threonylcarbamoyladenosine(37)-N6)-methyltransferase TrmO [Stygiolobus azoricus]|uniref:tRNA (N6-threonylcarbamoyladenosine(37)-N6)-methyltransferase TrmO n=1 Tax=Stygiolobus azoricus TaxID=41675 RepID=A0A650CPP3_9CREN|nr:tRNA (N6-threonylcarbamoyladenosine(37)-N6)-methyltransferase TrmO [Stygiolobus azoricus]QGR19809.1 tRNA (N6-threonylcarbamoyladenosine(37)-N6)-methyltransferase TrmO [Stygiolobus azoricus]
MELRPIGVVIGPSEDEVNKNMWKGGVKGIIKIYEEFKEGLLGIENFSHIILVSWLHKITEDQRKILIVKPLRMTNLGFKLNELPALGVFALHSPIRPNPIGITIVKLIERKDNLLYVEGLDLYDGTPILDIKGYYPYDLKDVKIPKWLEKSHRIY